MATSRATSASSGLPRRSRACLRRPEDLVCRFGGEEFLAFMPDTDIDGALIVAEKMRASVEAEALAHESSPFGAVTVSVGVAGVHADADLPMPALIERADGALYEAKRNGRNRVLAAGTAGADT